MQMYFFRNAFCSIVQTKNDLNAGVVEDNFNLLSEFSAENPLKLLMLLHFKGENKK